MSEESGGKIRGNHLLRIGAGVYLVYLAYGLAEEFLAKTASNLWVAAGAAVVFGVVGVALVVTSGITLYKNSQESE